MAAPSFVQASAGWTITGTSGAGSLSGAVVGNFLLLQVLVDTSAAFPIIGSGSGFEKVDGTDNDMDLIAGIQVGATDLGAMRTWVGRVTNSSVSITVDTNGSTNDMFCRLYEFSGVSSDNVIANVVENTASQNQATSSTITDADVTATVAETLAINCVGVVDNQALSAFTGATGGTWSEPVAEYVGSGTVGVIQLQIAALGSPGTINGGSLTMGGSAAWGIQGMTFRPTVAGGGGGAGSRATMTMMGVG